MLHHGPTGLQALLLNFATSMQTRMQIQVIECLQTYTQSLPFQCTKYDAASYASLPVDFSDTPGCSWEQISPPQWSGHTQPAAVPALTAAVAALCEASSQPQLDLMGMLQELGQIFSTCAAGNHLVISTSPGCLAGPAQT